MAQQPIALLLVLAAALCVLPLTVAGQGDFQLPIRPTLESATKTGQRRLTHRIAAIHGNPRRFIHSDVIDQQGESRVAEYMEDLPGMDDLTGLRNRAEELAQEGLTVFQYDVELAEHTRVLDTDMNVLKVGVFRVPQNESQTLVELTVRWMDQALQLYVPGTVIQGSHMWGVRNKQGGELITVLGAVETVTQIDTHHLHLIAHATSYRNVFQTMTVVLVQPSLATSDLPPNAPVPDDPTVGSPSRHPLSIPSNPVPQQALHPHTEGLTTSFEWGPYGGGGTLRSNVTAFQTNCTAIQAQCQKLLNVSVLESSKNTQPKEVEICLACLDRPQINNQLQCQDCGVEYQIQLTSLQIEAGVVQPTYTTPGYSKEICILFACHTVSTPAVEMPSGLPYGFFRMRAIAEARVNGNLDMNAQLQYAMDASGSFTLLPNIPIVGQSISLGAITLEFGVFLDINVKHRMALSAEATVRARVKIPNFYMTLDMSIDVNTNTDVANTLVPTITPINITQPTMQVEVHGHAMVEIALNPVLRVGISRLFSAQASTDLFVSLDGYFQYPPFPAFAGSSDYYNPPSGTSAYHLGSCVSSHLVQYAVQAGVKNSYVTAQVDESLGTAFGIDLGPISFDLSKLDYYKDLGTFSLPSFIYPLLSGCLLPYSMPTPAQGSSNSIVLLFTTPFNFSTLVDYSLFQYNLLQDLSAALKLSTLSIQVSFLTSNPYDPAYNASIASDISATMVNTTVQTVTAASVKVSILELDFSINATTLIHVIRQQMADTNSALRTGVMSRLLYIPVPPHQQESDAIYTESNSGSKLLFVWIGLGIGIFVLLLTAALISLYWYKRRNQKQTRPVFPNIELAQRTVQVPLDREEGLTMSPLSSVNADCLHPNSIDVIVSASDPSTKVTAPHPTAVITPLSGFTPMPRSVTPDCIASSSTLPPLPTKIRMSTAREPAPSPASAADLDVNSALPPLPTKVRTSTGARETIPTPANISVKPPVAPSPPPGVPSAMIEASRPMPMYSTTHRLSAIQVVQRMAITLPPPLPMKKSGIRAAAQPVGV